MNVRRRRFRLAGPLALGQGLGRGALAVALVVLVRELRAVDFGNLALGLAIAQVLVTVADGGFSRLLVRDVARGVGSGSTVVRRLLGARLYAVVIVGVLSTAGFALLPGPFSGGMIALLEAYLVTESIAFGFENAAVGFERPWRFVSAQAAAGIALLGGLAALVATGGAALTSAMAVLAGASAIKVVTHLCLWRLHLGASGAVRRPLGQLYREALPFLSLTLLATVYYRIGVIALHAVKGAAATASYAAALRVVDLVGIAAGVAFSSASPALSRLHSGQPDAVYVVWRRTVAKIALIAVPLAVVVALASVPIARLLFGGAYSHPTGVQLRILAPGMALMMLQSVSAAVVFMADGQRGVISLTCVNVSVCVIGSIVLSAALGADGAALALTAAEALSFTSFVVLIHHRHRSARTADRGRSAGSAEPVAPIGRASR